MFSTSSSSSSSYGSLADGRTDSFGTFTRKLDKTELGPSALGDIVTGHFRSLAIDKLNIIDAVSEYLELGGWLLLLSSKGSLALKSSLDLIRKSLLELRGRIQVLTPEYIADLLFAENGKLTLENAKRILGFKLKEAVENHDDKTFSYLLQERLVDPDAPATDQKTILCHLAYLGKVAQVKELVTYGANVNGNSSRLPPKTSPLLEAASNAHGNEEVVAFLLSKGANIHAPSGIQGEDGWDALMHASHFGNLPVVKILLQNKANVQAQDKWGNRALHLAALNRQAATVRALIRAGSDLSAVNHAGNTALTIAQALGYNDVLQALQEEPKKMERERIAKIFLLAAFAVGCVAFLYRYLPRS